ncbi:helix-turn-helix domain-containing protein [Streptomyces anulatus]|uniref:IclR family transcriptional regulator n=1 Tax=Streptomyces TaxID=1883 RepID=UPI0020629EAF|nr:MULTISPECIES: helix-turn-helix domain-containing protein [unclassified Streptomyces]UPT43495.1 helix-turn-helix domain-containing protein [Streptomyces sp. WAC00303]WTF62815.1 helix-turn-helix domain-containing protein [Streptomyces anulatus]
MTTWPSPTDTLRHDSGVAVLDKASLLLSVLEDGPASVSRIVALTGLTRPTAHRLALALQRLRLVTRDARGRFLLGPRLGEMAVVEHGDRMLEQTAPVLTELRDATHSSARLHRRCEGHQLCVAAAEAADAEEDAVPVGTAAGLWTGPVAQVLLAWEEPDVLYQGLARARFTAAMLAQVRHRGWAQGSGGPAVDAATLAVPVRGPGGRVVAALSLSGPRTGPRVREFTATMIDAAMRLGEACDG